MTQFLYHNFCHNLDLTLSNKEKILILCENNKQLIIVSYIKIMKKKKFVDSKIVDFTKFHPSKLVHFLFFNVKEVLCPQYFHNKQIIYVKLLLILILIHYLNYFFTHNSQ